MRIPLVFSSKVHPILLVLVAVGALVTVSWIFLAYLQPGLRKAVLYSGFGLC